MVKASRKQKGAGGFASKPVYADIEVDYSGKGLTIDELEELILREYPSRSERDRISTLIISGNNLNELPSAPFRGLITLDCNDNQLTLLSTSLYPDLLRSLTDLYPQLRRLKCSGNQLTSLPRLSPNIEIIECNNNRLTALPRLTDELFELECSHNQLTALPELPESLNFLICDNNKLTVLPELPVNLQEIVCHSNPFIPPFDKFVSEYNKTPYVSVLIDKVNRYYAEQRNNYAPMNKNKSIKSTMLNELKYMPPSDKYPGGQGYHSAYANFLEATNSMNKIPADPQALIAGGRRKTKKGKKSKRKTRTAKYRN